MTIPTAFTEAAESAVALLRDPAVTAAWGDPSALKDFTVGGLAAHLARQIVRTPEVLAAPVPDGEPITLVEHYSRAAWIGADLDNEANTGIRLSGEQDAAVGLESLVARTDEVLAAVKREFSSGQVPLTVHVPWTGWSLTLDDYLTTRLLELVVHSDDLAVSVGIETPTLPEHVVQPVIDLLARISVRRHGAVAVLRALSRSERAPESIAAL
jgi:hypothetical protein